MKIHLIDSNAVHPPQPVPLIDRLSGILSALSTRKLKRSVLFVGDVQASKCPNCDHEERHVILVYKDVATVQCPICLHMETVER